MKKIERRIEIGVERCGKKGLMRKIEGNNKKIEKILKRRVVKENMEN